MKENWKDAFSFNHRERKGTAILLTAIAILLLVDVFYPKVFPPEELSYTIVSYDSTEKSSDNLEKSKNKRKKEPVSHPVFNFNPNNVSERELRKLGLRNYQIEMFLNYRKAGGRFEKVEDFRTLYFVNDSIYERFEKHLVIPEVSSFTETVPTDRKQNDTVEVHKRKVEGITPLKKEKEKSFLVMMNQSDTSEWKRFYGIGSGYAHRIVKYRDILGGYVRKEQLLEVYGFDTVLYTQIQDQLVVDESFIKRMNLNTVSTNRLSKHPYITWNMARRITDSRVQDGPFESREDLLKRNLLNEVLYRKIVEYLEVY